MFIRCDNRQKPATCAAHLHIRIRHIIPERKPEPMRHNHTHDSNKLREHVTTNISYRNSTLLLDTTTPTPSEMYAKLARNPRRSVHRPRRTFRTRKKVINTIRWCGGFTAPPNAQRVRNQLADRIVLFVGSSGEPHERIESGQTPLTSRLSASQPPASTLALMKLRRH